MSCVNPSRDGEPHCKYKTNFNSVIRQLNEHIPKDKRRKVCKGCHDIGHNINGDDCKLKIEKKYMLSHQSTHLHW